MAIQLRRGAYANFDPAKMLPAEVGVVTSGDPGTVDGKAAYVAFAAGNVKKLATVDDIATEIDSAVDDAVQRAEDVAESIEASAAQIETNRQDIIGLKNMFTDNAKAALLACFRHVAWVDAQGQTYYDALESALHTNVYPRIEAVFNPGLNIIYTDTSLNSLKQYLTVMYYETEESTGVELEDNDYILSGVLVGGNSTIAISYDEVSTTVIVRGVVDLHTQYSFEYPAENIIGRVGNIVTDTEATRYGIGTLSSINYRYIFGLSSGFAPIYDTTASAYTNVYPIPIPEDASSITLEYDNGPVWGGASIWSWNGSRYTRSEDLGSFGYSGGTTKSFTSAPKQFATVLFGQPNNASFVTENHLTFCNVIFGTE